jgi:hypothetical protein
VIFLQDDEPVPPEDDKGTLIVFRAMYEGTAHFEAEHARYQLPAPR